MRVAVEVDKRVYPDMRPGDALALIVELWFASRAFSVRVDADAAAEPDPMQVEVGNLQQQAAGDDGAAMLLDVARERARGAALFKEWQAWSVEHSQAELLFGQFQWLSVFLQAEMERLKAAEVKALAALKEFENAG